MENYSQRSQEEIAKLTQSRVESDAKKIKEGARFVLDKGISTPRLEFTKIQNWLWFCQKLKLKRFDWKRQKLNKIKKNTKLAD